MTEGTRNCSYPFSSYDDPEVVGVSATYKFRYERGTLALIGAEVTAGSEEHRHHGSMASTSKSRLVRIAPIDGRVGDRRGGVQEPPDAKRGP